MTYLILFSVLLVAYWVKSCPPLEASRSTGALWVKVILAAVIGGCLGYGWAEALMDVVLK